MKIKITLNQKIILKKIIIKIHKLNNNLYEDKLIVSKNNLFQKIIKYLNSMYKMNKHKIFKKIHKVMINKMKVKNNDDENNELKKHRRALYVN